MSGGTSSSSEGAESGNCAVCTMADSNLCICARMAVLSTSMDSSNCPRKYSMASSRSSTVGVVEGRSGVFMPAPFVFVGSVRTTIVGRKRAGATFFGWESGFLEDAASALSEGARV